MDCSYYQTLGFGIKMRFKFHNFSSVCIFSAFGRRGDLLLLAFLLPRFCGIKVGVFQGVGHCHGFNAAGPRGEELKWLNSKLANHQVVVVCQSHHTLGDGRNPIETIVWMYKTPVNRGINTHWKRPIQRNRWLFRPSNIAIRNTPQILWLYRQIHKRKLHPLPLLSLAVKELVQKCGSSS